MDTKVVYCGCETAAPIAAKCGGNKVKQYAEQRVFPTGGAKFQDQKYGPGMRLHNVMKNGSLRCTVCSRVK